MRILLAGASGLVGGYVLSLARASGHDVVLVGRRELGMGVEEVLTDFREPVDLPPADVAVCALGTTIAAAGSKAAFYGVDHDAVINFADSASTAGVTHFLVVTAVGASPRARVFYSRVKGEAERDLEALAFRRLDIAQPGLLLGPRSERRPVEQLMKFADSVAGRFMVGPMDCYAGIEAEVVAKALVGLAEAQGADGVYRHQNRSLKHLGTD